MKHKKSQRLRRDHTEQSPTPEKDSCGPNYSLWAVVLGAFLSFIVSIDGDFVFDDAESVVKNVVVNGKVPVYEAFTRDYWGTPIQSSKSHKSYRPLTTITFWINYAIHGKTTMGFHLINILLHCVVSTQTYFLLKRMCSKEWISFAASMLFAVHPIHSEAVCNISGRAELLMSAFFLLGLRKVLDGESVLQVIVYTTMSLFSKEQGIMLLVFAIIYEALLNGCKKTAVFSYTVGLAGLIYLRMWINNFESPRFSSFDNAVVFIETAVWRWVNIVYLWMYNIYLMVNPTHLCFDYSMGCISIMTSVLDYRLAIVFAGALATLFAIGRIFCMETEMKRFCLEGTLIGCLSFLPASNIFFTVGFTIAERVLYLPSLGVCILATVFISDTVKSEKQRNTLLIAIITLFLSSSWKRSNDWRNELNLYSTGLQVCPNNAKIHYNLGKILNDYGQIADAEESYRKAISLNPNYEYAMNNLANIYEHKGEYHQAEHLLIKAVSIRPSFATAWMNLGIAQMHMNKFNESENSFEQSLRERPHHAEAYYNLGILRQKMNLPHKALAAWRTAVSLDPGCQAAWINLLVMLDELNRCDEAIDLSSTALRFSNHPAIHFQLGTCFGQRAQFEQAEHQLLAALRLQPNTSIYHANLGVLYQRWKKYEKAEISYRVALSLDANAAGVAANLLFVRNSIETNRNKTRPFI